MNRDTFLWQVYANVAKAFNTAKLPHTVLHGIDYERNIVGRDCDMLVSKNKIEEAISLTKKAFLQNIGGGISVIRWPWGCWCLMTATIDGIRYCAEIDIAWCYPYRTVVLTDVSLLGYNVKEIDHFYEDSWNQFAKCFLLRFLAGNFKSFNVRRIQEIEHYANQLALSNNTPNILRPDSLMWIEYCRNFDIEKLKAQRKKFRLWKYSLKRPIVSIKILLNAMMFFLSRKIRMYRVLGDLKVVADENTAQSLIEKEFEGSFITKFRYVACSSVFQYYFSYMKAYFTTPPFLMTVYVGNKKLTKKFHEINNQIEAKQLVDDFFKSIIIEK